MKEFYTNCSPARIAKQASCLQQIMRFHIIQIHTPPRNGMIPAFLWYVCTPTAQPFSIIQTTKLVLLWSCATRSVLWSHLLCHRRPNLVSCTRTVCFEEIIFPTIIPIHRIQTRWNTRIQLSVNRCQCIIPICFIYFTSSIFISCHDTFWVESWTSGSSAAPSIVLEQPVSTSFVTASFTEDSLSLLSSSISSLAIAM